MKKLFFMTALSVSTLAFGSEQLGDCKGIVDYVYDGDTIFVSTLECEFYGEKTLKRNVKTGIRVLGIDTPEIKGKTECERDKAQEAKQFVANKVKAGSVINITKAQDDKFGGRVDGTIFINGKDLTDMLIEAKLGYRYYGEKKQNRNWCY